MRLPSLSLRLLILIFITLVGIGVVLRVVVRWQQATTPLPTPGIEGRHSPLPQTRVSYIGPSLEIPESLSVFQVQRYDLMAQAEQLAASLNLTRDTESSRPIWRSADRFISVSILESFELIQYSRFITANDLPQGLNESQARQQAQAFLNNLNLGYLSIIEDSVQFLDNSPEAQPVQQAGSAHYALFLAEITTSEGYPLYAENLARGDIRIWINAQGTVTKAEVPALPQLRDTGREVTLMGIQESLQGIERGEATVVSVGSLGMTAPLNLNQVQTMEIEHIQVQYRVDGSTNIAYPYYSFRGEALFANGEEHEIEVIRPAFEGV